MRWPNVGGALWIAVGVCEKRTTRSEGCCCEAQAELAELNAAGDSCRMPLVCTLAKMSSGPAVDGGEGSGGGASKKSSRVKGGQGRPAHYF